MSLEMTDNTRNTGSKGKGSRNASDDALYALYDSLEDLYSILETLDELGIKTRDDLVAYIDTLDAEVEELESIADR
jgi:hypothetical protein